jgi:hypothetical protein
MSFSDEDLRQLKAFTERHVLQPEYTMHTSVRVMEYLIARLEAAEAYIYARSGNSYELLQRYDDWRKSQGR